MFGVLVGFSVAAVLLVVAIAVVAGYSIGKDLALRDNARAQAAVAH